MIRMSIAERSGQPKLFTFPKDDITIGRAQGNDIILPRNNISKRHTRIFRKGGKLVVRDLDSTNGTFLNGRRIHDDEMLHAGDRIFLADFVLIVEEDEQAATPVPPELKPSVPPPLPPAGQEEIPELEARAAVEQEPSEISLSPSDLETAPPDMVLSDLAKAAARRAAPEAAPLPAEPPMPARPSRLATPAPVPHPAGRRGPEIAPTSAAEPTTPAAPTPFRPSRTPAPGSVPVPAALEPFDEESPRATVPAPAPTPTPATTRGRGRAAVAEPDEHPAPAARASQTPRAPAKPAPAKAEPPPPAPRRAPKQTTLPLPEVRDRLLARVNEVVRIKEAEPSMFGDPDLQGRVKSALLDELAILEAEDLLDAALDRDVLVEELTTALFGLGPLRAMANDESLEAFVAYPDGAEYERRDGKWHRAEHRMIPALLSLLARRLAAGIAGRGKGGPAETFRGQHPDLPGVEVCGALGGSALPGAVVRLERAPVFPDDFNGQADAGLLSLPMATFLKSCVEGRQAVAVVGPQRASRTALLRALVAALPTDERVVWVAEPGGGPPKSNATVVAVTPPSVGEALLAENDDGGAGMADLIQWLQPSLVVVEHADAARDVALLRAMHARLGATVFGVEADRWEAAAGEPSKGAAAGTTTKAPASPGVDPRLAVCADLVVEVLPLIDGTCRTLRIGDRAADGGDPFTLAVIFEFFSTGAGEGGELLGEYRATRAVPRFIERRKARGKRVDLSPFQG
jgi:pilus assembly protein CpaF